MDEVNKAEVILIEWEVTEAANGETVGLVEGWGIGDVFFDRLDDGFEDPFCYGLTSSRIGFVPAGRPRKFFSVKVADDFF
jgi:hypothetical protein